MSASLRLLQHVDGVQLAGVAVLARALAPSGRKADHALAAVRDVHAARRVLDAASPALLVPGLVQRGQERAGRLGFRRMRFLHGGIAEASLPERIHLLTALHACDTATDDALLLALRHNADHIAVVPCCQAEVAAQLKEMPRQAPAPWPQLWAHPIHRREIGAHLTNVVRALALQSLGYQVTVTELTGWEHSLKNELILARRVHKEHRGARKELDQLLETTGIRPKLIRELFDSVKA